MTNSNHRKTIHRTGRRGATAVQVAVVLGLVTLTAMVGITQIGSQSNSQLTQTAGDVGNPSSLVGRFGNTSTGGSGSGGSSGSQGGSGSAGGTGSEGSGGAGGDSLCP